MWEDWRNILGFTPKNSRKTNYSIRFFYNNKQPLQFPITNTILSFLRDFAVTCNYGYKMCQVSSEGAVRGSCGRWNITGGTLEWVQSPEIQGHLTYLVSLENTVFHKYKFCRSLKSPFEVPLGKKCF